MVKLKLTERPIWTSALQSLRWHMQSTSGTKRIKVGGKRENKDGDNLSRCQRWIKKDGHSFQIKHVHAAFWMHGHMMFLCTHANTHMQAHMPYRPRMGTGVFKLLHDETRTLMRCSWGVSVVWLSISELKYLSSSVSFFFAPSFLLYLPDRLLLLSSAAEKKSE